MECSCVYPAFEKTGAISRQGVLYTGSPRSSQRAGGSVYPAILARINILKAKSKAKPLSKYNFFLRKKLI